MLVELQPDTVQQTELFAEPMKGAVHAADKPALMQAIDGLNQRYGRGAVKVASAGASSSPGPRGWTTTQERRTPAYTSNWADIPTARA